MNLKEKVRIVPDYPKQGIRFMDITTLFKDADAFKELVERMKRELDGIKVDAVVGPEARGFVLGATLAYSMGVGFVPARKPGKLPAEVVSRNYKFGDGEQCLQIHKDAIKPGDKVVVESSTKKIFGVVALVYVLPVVLFLLGYFLSEGLAEGMRYAIAVATFVVSFIPCVLYDRHARKKELLTYQIMRLF